ncbi:unnamed protein product [Parajaminaea phylloscopi]
MPTRPASRTVGVLTSSTEHTKHPTQGPHTTRTVAPPYTGPSLKVCNSQVAPSAVMEDSMERVAKQCASQLDTFQRCILANQKDPGACEPYKVALSQCASAAVPIMAAVKARCEPQIRAFDACLKENSSAQITDEEVNERCGPRLRELWKCTEATKREEERKASMPQSNQPGGVGSSAIGGV